MRLPYVPNPPQFENADDQAIVERVQQRRGEEGLLELDLSLLHSPPVADGWNSFLGSIRTQTTLSTSIRETAICRVAILNNAWFEWEHHAPILRACPNIKEEHIRHILQAPQPKLHETVSAKPVVSSVIAKAISLEKWTEARHEVDYVDEKHLAVIAYTDAMTLGVRVSNAVFERLKQNFSDREIVEITATIAAYNCVSRFLVALDVGERNAQERPAVH